MTDKDILAGNVLGVYESIIEEKEEPCPDLNRIYNELYLELMDDVADEAEDRFGDDCLTDERLDILGIDMSTIPTLFQVKEILDELNLPYMYSGNLHNSLQLRFY